MIIIKWLRSLANFMQQNEEISIYRYRIDPVFNGCELEFLQIGQDA